MALSSGYAIHNRLEIDEQPDSPVMIIAIRVAQVPSFENDKDRQKLCKLSRYQFEPFTIGV
jgi:hypothetical protein